MLLRTETKGVYQNKFTGKKVKLNRIRGINQNKVPDSAFRFILKRIQVNTI